jgi:glucose-1-phosphate thymidylyltransferase
MPIYEKLMIDYPLLKLKLACIQELLIISMHEDLPRFEILLGNCSEIGVV